MRIDRGFHDRMPYAALGSGRPLVVLVGVTPVAGVRTDTGVRTMLSGLIRLAATRRLTVLNRRRGLPAVMTMTDFAAEHAAALRRGFDGPVDVLGVSTGGSIAQQLAAEHPDLVRRLVIVSSACRLGGTGKATQDEIARQLRAGRRAAAAGTAVAAFVPAARTLARAASGRLIPTERDAADLAATLEAEDGFDLAACPPVVAPTLIIAGSRDRLYPPELFRETADLIAGAQLQVLPRRGHTGAFSGRPVAALVERFLVTPPAGRSG